MQQIQEQHSRQIRNLQGIHNQELEAKDKEISRLNIILEKAFCWFPLLKEMLRMEKLCYVIGFTKGMVDSLLYKREAIRCSGKIYSEEYRRRFETKNATFKIEQSPVDGHKLMLTINRQPIGEWFKEQWEKLKQGLYNSVQTDKEAEDSKCNPIVFDWNSIKFTIFASGWRELCPRHIIFRKKRYAHLVILRT